jgi:hypothetical protein
MSKTIRELLLQLTTISSGLETGQILSLLTTGQASHDRMKAGNLSGIIAIQDLHVQKVTQHLAVQYNILLHRGIRQDQVAVIHHQEVRLQVRAEAHPVLRAGVHLQGQAEDPVVAHLQDQEDEDNSGRIETILFNSLQTLTILNYQSTLGLQAFY